MSETNVMIGPWFANPAYGTGEVLVYYEVCLEPGQFKHSFVQVHPNESLGIDKAKARKIADLVAAAPELYVVVEKSAHALETIAAKLDEVAQTQLADILRAGATEQRATLAKARGES